MKLASPSSKSSSSPAPVPQVFLITSGQAQGTLPPMSSSHYATLCRVVSCRVAARRVASCRVVSYRIVSCLVVSCRVASCRVASCCVVSGLGSAEFPNQSHKVLGREAQPICQASICYSINAQDLIGTLASLQAGDFFSLKSLDRCRAEGAPDQVRFLLRLHVSLSSLTCTYAL